MIWLKKNLLFTIIMVLLAGVLAVEIFYILRHRQTAVTAENAFEEKVEEHRSLSGKAVLPHERNVALTQAEIDRQREELTLYYKALEGSDDLQELLGQAPGSRTDAWYDITSFVEEYRERARAANVQIPQDEYFGFGAYSTAGPREDRIPEIYKQRVIVAHILDQLFKAQPRALLTVQRAGDGPSGRNGGPGGEGAFRLDPQLSVDIPDLADTLPFQVVFTGHTDALRAFLNELASFEMPLVVRSVQVTPEGEAQQAGQQNGGRRRAPRREQRQQRDSAEEQEEQEERVPIVRDNISRFTVAMEFVDVRPQEDSR